MNYSKTNTLPSLFFSHQITITSASGVGSSSTLAQLRLRLGDKFEYMSGGDAMREIAKNYKLSIEDFVNFLHEHPEIDYEIDHKQREFAQKNYRVIESRLAHVFCPHGFHVLLTCPAKKRAERLTKKLNLPFNECLRKTIERDVNDEKRYAKIYPGSIWPQTDFDHVISTEENPPEIVAQIILGGLFAWRSLLPQECLVQAKDLP